MFRIKFEKGQEKTIRKKFESSFNARESVEVFIWRRPPNVGITVAYLFNIVNEPQITDLYFHNVLHCAACRSLRFLMCTSFSHSELYELYFISFKLHKVYAKNKVRKLRASKQWYRTFVTSVLKASAWFFCISFILVIIVCLAVNSSVVRMVFFSFESNSWICYLYLSVYLKFRIESNSFCTRRSIYLERCAEHS